MSIVKGSNDSDTVQCHVFHLLSNLKHWMEVTVKHRRWLHTFNETKLLDSYNVRGPWPMKIAKNPHPHQGSVQGWRSKKDNSLRVIYMTTTTTIDTITVANASTTIAVASVLLPKPEKKIKSPSCCSCFTNLTYGSPAFYKSINYQSPFFRWKKISSYSISSINSTHKQKKTRDPH